VCVAECACQRPHHVIYDVTVQLMAADRPRACVQAARDVTTVSAPVAAAYAASHLPVSTMCEGALAASPGRPPYS